MKLGIKSTLVLLQSLKMVAVTTNSTILGMKLLSCPYLWILEQLAKLFISPKPETVNFACIFEGMGSFENLYV